MAQPIKILQLAKHFYPDTGGIETVTQSISEMLPAHGVEADVLCTAVRETYPPHDLPYKVFRCSPGVRFGRNKSLSWSYVQAVRELVDLYDLAIVHLPNPVAVAAVLAFWRKPFILLWHADIPQAPIRTLCTPMDRQLAARAAAVIGPTGVHISESHHADALKSKGVVIGYPFDRSRLPAPSGTSAAAERVRSFARGRKIALSIGRLVPYKGFDVLIDAAPLFGADLVSVIIGGGPLAGELQQKIDRQGVADRVLLAGQISDPELADLLDQAHMGCMPSVTAAEMYGVAQVEAFAFGKPVVSTRLKRSGVPYINKDGVTGLVVEPGDREQLAVAMRRLVEDQVLYTRLAEGATRSFAADHDIGPIGQRYAELIRSVLGQRGAAAPSNLAA